MTRRPMLRIPAAAGVAVARHVASHGRLQPGVETGGFMLSPVAGPRVEVVAVTGGAGITRRPDQFHVSGAAVEMLSEWAEDRELRIAAQFHSHGTTAFLSWIDRAAGFRVRGFTTTVVPAFADPSADPSEWGWWRFGRDWEPIAPPRPTPGEIDVITFDEDGAR